MSDNTGFTLNRYDDGQTSFALGPAKQNRSKEEKTAAAFMNSDASKLFLHHYKNHLPGISHLFTGILFALFVVVLLMAIIVGTNVYRALYIASEDTDIARTGTSLIANTVRANDIANSVAVGTGPEGPSLVLSEHVDKNTYETRIYLYNGNILEEYSISGTPYTPEKANVLTASDIFEFDYSRGLLSITTSEGTVDVALRSTMGGGR